MLRRRHAAFQSTKNALFALPHLAHLLTIKNRSKTMEDHEKPSKIFGREKPRNRCGSGVLYACAIRSALGELRRAAGGLEAVLARLFARNPCIYLVFAAQHLQFPHSLTTDKILFLLIFFEDAQLSSVSVCGVNASFTTSESSSGLLYLAFA